MKLDFYENLADNIKKQYWESVWDDSFLAVQGAKIRKHLIYDGESCGPKTARDEDLLRIMGLTLVGDYAGGDFE